MSGTDQLTLTLSTVALLVAIAGVGVAVKQLGEAAEQTRRASKAAQATLWLEFRKLLLDHADIHAKLRPGGEWADDPASGPDTQVEWVRVESYMGLLEQCGRLLEEGLLDDATFNNLYRYRLVNLVHNDVIRCAKLIDRSESWQDLLALLGRAGINLRDCP